ncbi:MAG: S-layer homology domain-containing protein [Defluviitaleaceae bacterium]|nr:S-layer homology domain-containing protein [Defluviitaleaceae bacterium]
MRKLACLVLSIVFAFTMFGNIEIAADDLISGIPTENTFTGRREASVLISTLNFNDVPNGHWANEAIVRGGAFGMISGGSTFSPNASVSNQEALAFVIRLMGAENAANQARVTQAEEFEGSPIANLWSLGYLNHAAAIGLIDQEDFDDATVENQAFLNPQFSFLREAPATREQVVSWLVQGINIMTPGTFPLTDNMTAVRQFNDWGSIGVPHLQHMEAAVRGNIISGTSPTTIAPQASLTRAQMAQLLTNVDSIYFTAAGIARGTGTVGAIVDTQTTVTGVDTLVRQIQVRNAAGLRDDINYELQRSGSPQSGITDAVVFRNGRVASLTALQVGDQIEYFYRTEDNVLLYVNVVSELQTRSVQGTLMEANLETGAITIRDATGRIFVYNMQAALYDQTSVRVDGRYIPLAQLPIGSRVELTLANNIVSDIRFLGAPQVVSEFRGIVVENNPAFGYITVLSNDGNLVTMQYDEQDMRVLKRQYFDVNNLIGYIAEVFPNFRFNPLESPISEIEPGNIVFIRPDPENPDRIAFISAATNYTTRFARIVQINRNGLTTSITVEYENRQIAFFDVATEILVLRDGRAMSMDQVQVGDRARLLINQAQIEPGHIWESIRQIQIETSGHLITDVVKGRFLGIDPIQRQMQIEHAEILTPGGWRDHRNVRSLSLAGNDIEYFLDGRRVSLDFVTTNLRRMDGDVYIALEGNFAGDRVRKVSFRTGREELLPSDTVMSADGGGTFHIIGNNGGISTDAGSIVVRNGRLVSGNDILPFDHVGVVLNGQSRAAVVNIGPAPDVSLVNIARVRIQSVNEGRSFTTTALSLLTGSDWVYSPIQREFTIGHDTLFISEDGPFGMDQFLGFTENNVINNTYYVVFEGSRATMVVAAPFATRMVRGTIFENNEASLQIRDVRFYEEATGRWLPVSHTNNTGIINIPTNGIIARHNQTVHSRDLRVGDQIKVFTDTLPSMNPGFEIDGYIIIHER